ncbi:hypothetical protein ESCO_004910 [Escovopsis weberi]|uniref:Uncharacterized protein n=1 Tax=Escovopsis weberi TaxID=150374 RepID=A0A0M8MUA0_ESCWE|nr:hypothetical protein ESCO_004910 [Escovopsis weberi]
MVSFFGLRFGADKKKQQHIGSVSQIPGGEDLAASAAASKPVASPASLMLPSPYGNSVSLPGTPNKPQSARTKKWVDPLDTSISRSLSADDAGTTDMSVKSPLDKIRFDVQELGERGGMRIEQDRDMLDHDDGCPSPPRSVDGGNELRPTISVTSIGSRVPAPLPSPAPSAPVSAEDKWEIPRIRNVKAKRDTMTFQSPRRRSFTMAIEQGKEDKQRMQQRRVEHTTQVVEISSHCMSAEEMRASLCIDMVESPTEMAQPHPFKEEQASQDSSEPLQEKPQGSPSQSTSTNPAAEARSEQPDPDAKLFEREAPKGFNSRARSDSNARSPRPSLYPLKISTTVQPAAQPLEKPPVSPLASKTPMEGYFPVSNGLPRGRLPGRPSISVETSEKEHDNRSSVYSAPAKEEVDISEPCKSAIPKPLFLSGLQDLSPGATMAPLPSPTFSNVDRVLSKDTIELAKTFEISLDLPQTSPIQCDFGDFGDFLSRD